jgi:predicted dehydrogenase
VSEQVNVGLVGLGTIAKTHLDVLATFPQVVLQFTVDPHVTEAPVLRGVTPPRYGDLVSALREHRPQLIVIATPTDTHVELAAQAVTLSSAKVLVEKPLVHSLAALAELRALDDADVAGRIFTAHHFAFSPEVRWAAEQMARHPEWGPVTGITSAFYDPYILRGEQAFASYISSWMDSGVNQLSVLARFVDLNELSFTQETDDKASAWSAVTYHSRGRPGTARLRSSWLTGASSKETTLTFGDSEVEIWIDHTAMTGFTMHGTNLLSSYGNDGRIPRKIAHYRPLYESLLSDSPDPVLRFDTAASMTTIHHATT